MTSLYRKWRSRSFDDLYGQDHVVRTLRNAVRQGRISHAYLFTGPRGTGKTSAARILAKAVNCLDPVDGSPCNNCDQCRAANEGRAMDVIEMDAASNTGVDDVRDLRERVGYAASEGRYKVYIVDEVHRLSANAFDAFLKTLEEPPPHVIFVFASTEPHKVPATIASRCQRFDFRRIPPDQSMLRLREVAGEEHMQVTDEALQLVVLHANGSLRDALGVLDQVSSYTQGEIGAAEVRDALGLANPELVAQLTDALIGGDTGEGLTQFQRFVDAGGEPRQLLRQMVDYWRVLLLAVAGSTGSTPIDPALSAHVGRHASSLDGARVAAVIRALTEMDFSAKYNVPPQLPFELGYIEASLAARPGKPAARAAPPPLPATLREAPAEAPLVNPKVEEPPAAARTSEPPAQEASQPAPAEAASDGAASDWPRIIEAMKANASLQAVLRAAYPLRTANGEMTIGFPYEFHLSRFSDPKSRKVLEEAVAQVLGASYRVTCVKATKEDIDELRAQASYPSDDGFVEEAEQRLRRFHIRELNEGVS